MHFRTTHLYNSAQIADKPATEEKKRARSTRRDSMVRRRHCHPCSIVFDDSNSMCVAGEPGGLDEAVSCSQSQVGIAVKNNHIALSTSH